MIQYSPSVSNQYPDGFGSLYKKLIVNTFSICPQTIYNWLALEEEQGHLSPKSGFQHGHSHGIKDIDAFKAYVDTHSDYTQQELGDYFGVGSSTISRTLIKIGYSRKKRVKHMQKEVLT